jgi:hypothetical protein
MSEPVKTPFNKLYQHHQGEIFFLKASAVHHKTGVKILILGSIEREHQIYVEVDDFYTPNPKTGTPRFQMITPTK